MYKKTKINFDNVYTLDLSYDKRDYIVDTIIRKLNGWKKTSKWRTIQYMKRDVTIGFWFFKTTTNNILVSVDSVRYMRVMCDVLWIKFSENKFTYEKDLFRLI